MNNKFRIMGLAICAALSSALPAEANVDTNVPATVTEASGSSLPVKVNILERSDNLLQLGFSVDVSSIPDESNRETLITPVISDGSGNSVCLTPVLLAGRNRYYQALRHNAQADDLRLYRRSAVNTIDFSDTVGYQPWMDGATITLQIRTSGCCSDLVAEAASQVTDIEFPPTEFISESLYVVPEAEAVKERAIEGSAYIDFPVNVMQIRADYRRNPDELAKIRETVEPLRSDPDITLNNLSIRGYASPEGPYDNNLRLAKGRTQALADYVVSLYAFNPSLMSTSWEAEDWDGLVSYLRSHPGLDNCNEILALATDTSLKPDSREWAIKSRYPQTYRFLLENVYPALRHSDYRIDYTIRSYSTPAEIAEVMRTAPQKLSLAELFTLAQTLDPESDQFREVFEVAVRMYPDDPVANLNAASTALNFGDLSNAERYLAKSGDSDNATFLRGVLAAKQGDYTTALSLFRKAEAAGIRQATAAIAYLRKMKVI